MYVYVLSSDESDFYYEQALLSATSLKARIQDGYVVLVVDEVTAKTFADKRRKLPDMASEVKVVTVDKKFNKKARSRFLKTSLRSHIAGDFLFIDCDTVTAGDLSEIQRLPLELGMVLDAHCCLDVFSSATPFQKGG